MLHHKTIGLYLSILSFSKIKFNVMSSEPNLKLYLTFFVFSFLWFFCLWGFFSHLLTSVLAENVFASVCVSLVIREGKKRKIPHNFLRWTTVQSTVGSNVVGPWYWMSRAFSIDWEVVKKKVYLASYFRYNDL